MPDAARHLRARLMRALQVGEWSYDPATQRFWLSGDAAALLGVTAPAPW